MDAPTPDTQISFFCLFVLISSQPTHLSLCYREKSEEAQTDEEVLHFQLYLEYFFQRSSTK